MPLMDPRMDLNVYTAVLERIYGLVAPWERLAEQVAPPALSELVRARARQHLLQQDLASLGRASAGLALAPFPEFHGVHELLGAMYVMEGSRLGGQLIARHVEQRFHFVRGEGSAYFRGLGDGTGAKWKEFVEVLETTIPDEAADRTIAAAKSMFSSFGEWMRSADWAIAPSVQTTQEGQGPDGFSHER